MELVSLSLNLPLWNKSLLQWICHYEINLFYSEFAVMEVTREDEFSPLKNAPTASANTPTTARQDLINLHYKYIMKAGGRFVNSDGTVLASDLK